MHSGHQIKILRRECQWFLQGWRITCRKVNMSAGVATPWDTVIIVHGDTMVLVWIPDLFGTSQSILPRLRTGKICSPWFYSSCFSTFHFLWPILFIPGASGELNRMKKRIKTWKEDVSLWFRQYNSLWRKSISVRFWIHSKCICVFHVNSLWMVPKTIEDEEERKTLSLLYCFWPCKTRKNSKYC